MNSQGLDMEDVLVYMAMTWHYYEQGIVKGFVLMWLLINVVIRLTWPHQVTTCDNQCWLVVWEWECLKTTSLIK